MDKRMGFNHQISEEAAEWLIEFRTGDIDAAGRREFDSWVRASPEHLRAFIEMAALWSESGAVDAQRRLEIEAILWRSQDEQQVIALSPEAVRGKSRAPARTQQRTRSTRTSEAQRGGNRRTRSISRVTRFATAASVLAVTVGTALILRSSLFGPSTYHTGVGEQRSFRLPDGSRVVLDSRSRLRVDFTRANRTVELLQGQGLFYVVKNPLRPFLVHVGGAMVRDVGTQFDVNRRGNGAVITVVEGQVSVTTFQSTFQSRPAVEYGRVSKELPLGRPVDISIGTAARMQPILLSAGEQLDVAPRELPPRPVHVDANAVTAWTHGQLVLESATLPQVAEAFDRYSARKLVARDEGTPELRLSGVFATNPAFLIRYLHERPDIMIRETDSEIDIVRSPRADQ